MLTLFVSYMTKVHLTTHLLQHSTTAVLTQQGVKEFRTTHIFSSNRTSRLQSANQWIRMILCSFWAVGVWSGSTAGQQTGTEKQTGHTPLLNWTRLCHVCVLGRGVRVPVIFFWPSNMVVYWEFAKTPAELVTYRLVSACVSTPVKKYTTQESTLEKLCQKGTEKSALVTEEPKITHLTVSPSHSLFFFCNVSFYIVARSQPVTQPPKSLSFRLSVVMETSQVSVLPAVAPAVHCGIWGLVLKT